MRLEWRALLEDSAPPIYRWKQHALHGPGRDEPSRRRTEVAVGGDGEIRGAVTAAHHSVHRGQDVLAVTVAPAHRRHGLGRERVAEGLRMRRRSVEPNRTVSPWSRPCSRTPCAAWPPPESGTCSSTSMSPTRTCTR